MVKTSTRLTALTTNGSILWLLRTKLDRLYLKNPVIQFFKIFSDGFTLAFNNNLAAMKYKLCFMFILTSTPFLFAILASVKLKRINEKCKKEKKIA